MTPQRHVRRRCNGASRLAESQTERAGAVWELSILQIFTSSVLAAGVRTCGGIRWPCENQNKWERKRKDTQKSAHHTRPLNCFLLKWYDILALSNRITQISASKAERSSSGSSAEAAGRCLRARERPAERQTCPWKRDWSLYPAGGFPQEREDVHREKTECGDTSLLSGGGWCCGSAWSADFRSMKNNQLVFAHQKLLETSCML